MEEDLRQGAGAALRLAEGAALDEAIDTDDPASWPAFDEGVRCGWSVPPYDGPAWERTEGGRALMRTLRDGAPLTGAWLALALCHSNGRIRGAALERAAGRPALLPLIVLRCADWARPVRERARELLVASLDVEAAVRVAPLLLRVGGRSRGGFGVALLTGLLSGASPERAAPLLTDRDRTVRRFAYRLAMARGSLSPAELARAAARDDDAVVQMLCADAALAAVDEESAPEVLRALLGARSPRARSAGVTALRRFGGPEGASPDAAAGAGERAPDFLADRSAPVRACARYVVRQHGADPLLWYRERCADPADPALPPGAVIGLAECGQRADADVLRPLLDHQVPGVRAKAVAGLRALDVTDVARLRRLLDDPAPGVVGEATLSLLPSAGVLPEDWLLRRLDPERPRWVRVSACRLLHAHGDIAGLRAAVVLLGDADERLRTRAALTVRRVRVWGSASWSDPRITELLAEADRAEADRAAADRVEADRAQADRAELNRA
ncbi:hypothetical protein ACIPRD_20115 [Streptomyces sp. NPDC090108]|uniref:hypothetical protein n=1 Tax=Streptomyces sp. NPDC090108 TaxID=3365947 RepID=UPI003805EE8C